MSLSDLGGEDIWVGAQMSDVENTTVSVIPQSRFLFVEDRKNCRCVVVSKPGDITVPSKLYSEAN
jgi:hypothetical protein